MGESIEKLEPLLADAFKIVSGRLTEDNSWNDFKDPALYQTMLDDAYKAGSTLNMIYGGISGTYEILKRAGEYFLRGAATGTKVALRSPIAKFIPYVSTASWLWAGYEASVYGYRQLNDFSGDKKRILEFNDWD